MKKISLREGFEPVFTNIICGFLNFKRKDC
jgi:hypothetical protein